VHLCVCVAFGLVLTGKVKEAEETVEAPMADGGRETEEAEETEVEAEEATEATVNNVKRDEVHEPETLSESS
jgi:glycerate kinase